MNPEQFNTRVRHLLKQESHNTPQLWYLSFADKKFLGVVILRAKGLVHANLLSHRLMVNPGGQMMGVPLDRGTKIPKKYLNRLLTRSEVLEIFPDAKSLKEHEQAELIRKANKKSEEKKTWK